MANGRTHPHLAIHPGSPSTSSTPPITDPYNFVVTPPPDATGSRDPLGLWSNNFSNTSSTLALSSPDSAYPLDGPAFPIPDTSMARRTRSRPASAYDPSIANMPMPFPEPQLYRSTSHRSSLRPSPSRSSLGHRSTRSEVPLSASSGYRGESRPPSGFFASEGSSPEVCLIFPPALSIPLHKSYF